jgi:7-carboxy-7-deazaguanine synthase
MPRTLIQSNTPKKNPGIINSDSYLQVSELFGYTIQGEGISTGVPSTFLRLKGCTLDCIWCDTASVWREGDAYTFDELFVLLENAGLINELKNGQHLILTGGSPLKQQNSLYAFIQTFIEQYGFKPFIEVENECMLMPTPHFESIIDQWNNSPKLSNSRMRERVRVKPLVLSHLGTLKNSWFKFVVDCEEDWEEILETFIWTGFVKKEQIILMPCGENQKQLSITRPIAVEMAIKHGVRFCDRLHVTIWDRKTGV